MMAKLRRTPPPQLGHDVSAESLTFPIAQLLDGPRPGRDDPDADRRWLQQHRQVLALCDANPRFDPRIVLTLDARAREVWTAERLMWLTDVLRG